MVVLNRPCQGLTCRVASRYYVAIYSALLACLILALLNTFCLQLICQGILGVAHGLALSALGGFAQRHLRCSLGGA
eukprot:scaffold236187_cov24-Prasinocladus_malaysianus.AAC.1